MDVGGIDEPVDETTTNRVTFLPHSSNITDPKVRFYLAATILDGLITVNTADESAF